MGELTTGFVWHELYMWHDTGTSASVMPASLTVEPLGHIESPDSKRRIRNLLEVSGLLDKLVQLKPRPATEDEILRLHTREYVERIKKMSSAAGGDAGEETPFGRGSYEIALLAAGGCITAVDAVLDGKVDNVYALGARLAITRRKTRAVVSASSATPLWRPCMRGRRAG